MIFQCVNCKQYQYVKTTQKGKKCLRCGWNHSISRILNSGEIVNGITAAVEMVKKRQDEFGKKELGYSPEFRAFGDFTVAVKNSEVRRVGEEEDSEEMHIKFKRMLQEIYSTYKKFPLYIIEIMAENYGILDAELKYLIKRFQKKGFLVQVDDESYTVKI
ncbi:MAG: hypothetical protein ACFFG0_46445 [Candidatus Thorarchaeota archaeon]